MTSPTTKIPSVLLTAVEDQRFSSNWFTHRNFRYCLENPLPVVTELVVQSYSFIFDPSFDPSFNISQSKSNLTITSSDVIPTWKDLAEIYKKIPAAFNNNENAVNITFATIKNGTPVERQYSLAKVCYMLHLLLTTCSELEYRLSS